MLSKKEYTFSESLDELTNYQMLAELAIIEMRSEKIEEANKK